MPANIARQGHAPPQGFAGGRRRFSFAANFTSVPAAAAEGTDAMRTKKNTLLLTEDDRDAMRAAGRFNADMLDVLRPSVRAGVTTAQLDAIANQYTRDHGDDMPEVHDWTWPF